MKKTIITLTAVAFLFVGCSTNEVDNSAEEQSPENVEQEVTEPEELTTAELVLGDWEYTYDMEGTVIEMSLTLNEDGTYAQTTAGQASEGTWEFIDDEHIVVKSKNIISKDGQKWQIVKATTDELHIDWNANGDEAKVLEFTRKV
jgi:PBP1b-binding outer membrane lipoprotein LpoB